MSGTSPHDARIRLKEILSDSVYCALGLRESLEQERSALERQDSESLTAAAINKEQCVRKLKELENQRANISVAAGFGPEPSAMPELAQWCDEDSMIVGCWDHLMEIARGCSELNMTNGAIIRLRHRQIESNLSLLRGDSSETATYSPLGAEATKFGRHSLADA